MSTWSSTKRLVREELWVSQCLAINVESFGSPLERLVGILSVSDIRASALENSAFALSSLKVAFPEKSFDAACWS
jgi:hypothetical protein